MSILCVYVTTIASERAWFWGQIVDVLPIVDLWIVGGDFNNVETFEDWCAVSPHKPSLVLPSQLLCNFAQHCSIVY